MLRIRSTRRPGWLLCAVFAAGALSGPALAEADGFGTDEEALLEELSEAAADADDGGEEAASEDPDAEELDYEFEAECIRLEPRRRGTLKDCSEGSDCTRWDPPRSNRCENVYIEREIEVDFEYFGTADCRSSERRGDVTAIVLHNGGSALINYRTWLCRKAASHYTVNRDGTIFQHIGEERRAWHAGPANDRSIGIELETSIEWGGERCNRLSKRRVRAIAEREGVSEEEVVRVRCEPTVAQYEALSALIDDIRTRHEIDEILGHCEVDPPGGSSHSDPRAFDWEWIGMSNKEKQDLVEANETSCTWYHVHQDAEIEIHDDEGDDEADDEE